MIAGGHRQSGRCRPEPPSAETAQCRTKPSAETAQPRNSPVPKQPSAETRPVPKWIARAPMGGPQDPHNLWKVVGLLTSRDHNLPQVVWILALGFRLWAGDRSRWPADGP